ncbi:hypothetical protein QAD02_009682 [Eretmocerus hayati]|uniref:Uncharacterized protein n=1 Tax=Eretmocerus hayati TaxID=131215 RepID=A0ACC2NA12_9HYME|nr:hypothetical protein QAD02_009682 [Eretmocerus hayati]
MTYLILFAILLNIIAIHGYTNHNYEEPGPLERYYTDWDYVEVRPGARMFWWLFYTTKSQIKSPYERPLVIWLQGGPGDSGTGFGNFAEIGPLDMNLDPRQYSWAKECNILFIDSPVGTGFSYVDSDDLLAENNSQIAEDLLVLIRSFLDVKPNFRTVPTYIFSESYGAKMASEFALLWYRSRSLVESNLKGLSLGSAYISPSDALDGWAPYLVNQGIIDEFSAREIVQNVEKVKTASMEGRWYDALRSIAPAMKTAFSITGGLDIYNILQENKEYLDAHGNTIYSRVHKDAVEALSTLMNKKIKNFLGIPTNKTWSAENGDVIIALANDFIKPVTNIVECLLNETSLKILTYSGELDLLSNAIGAYKWSEKLSWRYAERWRSSPEVPFIVNNNVEAFYKSYDRFSYFRVLRAGHFTPIDNPAAMLEILKYMIGPENS